MGEVALKYRIMPESPDSDIENIVGIKEASTDPNRLADLKKHFLIFLFFYLRIHL